MRTAKITTTIATTMVIFRIVISKLIQLTTGIHYVTFVTNITFGVTVQVTTQVLLGYKIAINKIAAMVKAEIITISHSKTMLVSTQPRISSATASVKSAK